ncbi:hypothetical protein ACROYT_G007790 [Oculina patagonica]
MGFASSWWSEFEPWLCVLGQDTIEPLLTQVYKWIVHCSSVSEGCELLLYHQAVSRVTLKALLNVHIT